MCMAEDLGRTFLFVSPQFGKIRCTILYMEPNWDDLRIFLSLAREGTLTTAAKALGVSHPTVARRVQALEQQIGARLFERLPDRFVPTAAGEELLADTEAMEKAALSINRRSAGLERHGERRGAAVGRRGDGRLVAPWKNASFSVLLGSSRRASRTSGSGRT